MKDTKFKTDVLTRLALAEASAWMARTGSARAGEEEAFKEWLAASTANRHAFERVNDVWELIPGAVAAPVRVRSQPRRARRRRHWPRTLAVACAALLLVALGAAGTLLPTNHVRIRVYQTIVGQQKTVVLPDNTQVKLNTDTQIIVRYQAQARRVALKHGEALFHVMHNASRPFVLNVGSQQVVDLGTVFDVSHYTNGIVVTLLEGKVRVGNVDQPIGSGVPPVVLQAGQQLSISANGKRAIGRPDLADAMAWRRGEVYLNRTTLAEAVAELNRYNTTPIRIADPALASIRVSGVFSAHDPLLFAMAVAGLHEDVRVKQRAQAIVIYR